MSVATRIGPPCFPLVGILARAMKEVPLRPPAGVPAGPDIFRYATDTALGDLLRQAGITDVHVQTVRFSIQTTAAWLWDSLLASTVRLARGGRRTVAGSAGKFPVGPPRRLAIHPAARLSLER